MFSTGTSQRTAQLRSLVLVSLTALALALGVLCVPIAAQGDPEPSVTLDVPGEVFVGEDFSFAASGDLLGSRFLSEAALRVCSAIPTLLPPGR